MEQFMKEIHTISNRRMLEQLKSNIKDQVTDNTLRWDERMVLYKKVQLINQWILELGIESH
ncbi:MAG TPA: hypothetical protein VJ824_04265 [Bacillota bacterium]|nr:hypothetical protein [Bacillota bacterium]